MSVQNAISLLNAIDTEPTLRENMYRCICVADVIDYLNSQGYIFNAGEFEDAVNILHLKCQSYEAADELLHKADWVRFQLYLSKNTGNE